MTDDDVAQIQRCYPAIFHACHVDHLRARSSPAEISARESTILSHLDINDPMTPAALAAHLDVVPSSVSAGLKRLETLGYVKSTSSARDKRSIELRLTQRGREAMQESSVLDTKRLEALVELLTPSERAAARAGMTILAKAARELMIQKPKKFRAAAGKSKLSKKSRT